MNSNEIRKKILDLLFESRFQGLPSYVNVEKMMSELEITRDQCYFHLEFLKDKGYIDPLQSVGKPYVSAKITTRGIDFVEGGSFQEMKPKAPIVRKEENGLIETIFNEFFYDTLKKEINICFNNELFTSVFILSRKLIENLVIDILRKKFPPSSSTLPLYYDTQNGRFIDFSILLKNLEDNKDSFGIDKSLVEQFISLVKPFRPRANSNTHSIETLADQKDVEKFKIPEMIALLLRIHSNL